MNSISNINKLLEIGPRRVLRKARPPASRLSAEKIILRK